MQFAAITDLGMTRAKGLMRLRGVRLPSSGRSRLRRLVPRVTCGGANRFELPVRIAGRVFLDPACVYEQELDGDTDHATQHENRTGEQATGHSS